MGMVAKVVNAMHPYGPHVQAWRCQTEPDLNIGLRVRVRVQNSLDLENNRPIALADFLYKLYTSIVTDALTHLRRSIITSPLSKRLLLFSFNIPPSATAHTHQRGRRANFPKPICTICGLSSAFNCVDHDKLLCIMYDLG